MILVPKRSWKALSCITHNVNVCLNWVDAPRNYMNLRDADAGTILWESKNWSDNMFEQERKGKMKLCHPQILMPYSICPKNYIKMPGSIERDKFFFSGSNAQFSLATKSILSRNVHGRYSITHPQPNQNTCS